MIARRNLSVYFDRISEWSIYILIFALPFSKSLIEITIITALVSLLAKRIAEKDFSFSITYIEKLLFVWLILSLPSFLNTQYMSLSLRALVSKSAKFALLFLMVKEVINTRERLNKFLFMAGVSCFVILIDAFIQYHITHVDVLHMYPTFVFYYSNPSLLGFPTASFPFPNDFAAWILIFIFPAGMMAFWGGMRGWPRLIPVSAFIGLAYFLIATKVRGAWLGFLTAFALLTIFKLKLKGVIILTLIVLATLFINKSVLPDLVSSVSMADRSVMWKNSVEVFKKHPVIGNGLNTFFKEYMEARTDKDKGLRGSYAHNCYLQMASDIGIIGLISFLLFVAAVLGAGFKSLKSVKDPFYYSLIFGIAMGLVAFLVQSAVDTNLYSLPLAALFWLSSGLLLSVRDLAEAK